MMTFLTIIHIIVALVLISLVLLQDSKGGGALGIGGGSNSLLGATGAQSLASKMTRYVAVIFAFTCLALAGITAKERKSVLDNLPAAASTAPATAPSAAPANAPAAAATNPTSANAPATANAPSTGATTNAAPAPSAAPAAPATK